MCYLLDQRKNFGDIVNSLHVDIYYFDQINNSSHKWQVISKAC